MATNFGIAMAEMEFAGLKIQRRKNIRSSYGTWYYTWWWTVGMDLNSTKITSHMKDTMIQNYVSS